MIISSPEQVKNFWTAVNLNEHTRFSGCASLQKQPAFMKGYNNVRNN